MAREAYEDFLNEGSYEQYRYTGDFHKPRSWALKAPNAGGTTYNLIVQQDKDEKQPMVRAGCRYMTLREAKNHWGNGNHHRQKYCPAIMLQIAALMAIARAHGWTKAKFDPAMKKKKKRVKVTVAKRKAKKAVNKSNRWR